MWFGVGAFTVLDGSVGSGLVAWGAVSQLWLLQSSGVHLFVSAFFNIQIHFDLFFSALDWWGGMD